MRFGQSLLRVLLAAVVVAASARAAAAQSGRVSGVVKDEAGQTIRGATVRAENQSASPNTFTASTDDKGRFSVLGLSSGQWTVTAEGPGYASQTVTIGVRTLTQRSPLAFALKKIVEEPPPGVLGGLRAKDLQTELAGADALYDAEQWDQAIAAYKAILVKAPALSAINLQIGSAYRNKKDYDAALAAYNDVLKIDPANERASVGASVTLAARGDLTEADEGLRKATAVPGAGREVFYAYGDVKRARSEPDEAAKYYQKAADCDPTWGKPLYKLGLLALDRGDKDAAATLMERVISVDPSSDAATQARTVIEQIRK